MTIGSVSHLITLVRPRGHFRRYSQTDLLHRLAIDVELDFLGLLCREVSGFGSFQDLINEVAALSGDLGPLWSGAMRWGLLSTRALLKSVMGLVDL
jgi:hypothetical protein